MTLHTKAQRLATDVAPLPQYLRLKKIAISD
jgi:hypothetical protein